MILFLIGAAIAAEPHLHANLDGLSPEARADVLFESYVRHFETPGEERWSCGTGVVMELKEHWHDFTPAQRAQMNAHLVPWGGDLLEPFKGRQAPPPDATDTCFGALGPNRIVTEHFAVDYDDEVSVSIAEDFGEYLEFAYNSLVYEEGWTPIISDTRYLMAVFVSKETGDGAYTTIEYCDKGGWMPYIVAYQNVFSDKQWSKDMAAHEFNHAQQYSYSFAYEFWIWEATATWIEDLVYPNSNGWADYVNGGYSTYPYISMRGESQRDPTEFYHMYGMAIWFNYLEEHVGGKELILGMWEDAASDYRQYKRTVEEALEERGVDFYEIYPEFVVVNTTMEYEDQDELSTPRRMASVSELPASDTFDNGRIPEGLGQNYLYFHTDITTTDAPDLHVVFNGDSSADAWIVRLVGVKDEAVSEVVELEVSEGVGEGTLEDLASFDDAWLVVSPLGGINDAYGWGYEATAIGALDSENPDGDNPNYDGDKPLDDGKGVCSTAPGQSAAALGIMGLMLAVRRRR